MKKKNIILGLLLGLGLAFLVPQQVEASLAGSCNAPTTGVDVKILSYPKNTSHTITVNLSSNFDPDVKYRLTAQKGLGQTIASSPWFYPSQNSNNNCNNGNDCVSVNNKVITWTITMDEQFIYGDGTMKTIRIDLVPDLFLGGQCDIGNLELIDSVAPGNCDSIEIYQERNGERCYQNDDESACFDTSTVIHANVLGLKTITGEIWGDGPVGLKVKQIGGGEIDEAGGFARNGNANLIFNPSTNSFPTTFSLQVEEREWLNEDFPGCSSEVVVKRFCDVDACEDENVIEIDKEDDGDDPWLICNQILNPDSGKVVSPAKREQYDKCKTCFDRDIDGDGSGDGIWTAIGCIDTSSTEGIVGKLMTVGISIAGGIALLMILASAFLFATSEGEPKRTSEAKEILTSAIIGLIFIIFSVTVLQFIGVNILKIPGFGE